jgi:hypothetical protein
MCRSKLAFREVAKLRVMLGERVHVISFEQLAISATPIAVSPQIVPEE